MKSQMLTNWTELRNARTDMLELAQREIALFARDLSGHALDAPETQAKLTAFFRGSRQSRLRIAVHEIERVVATHPRLMSLLKLFGHQLLIRESPRDLKHLPDQLLLVDARFGVVHFQHDQPRGKTIVDDEEAVQPYLRRFEELWAVCEPPISGTPLGL